MLILLLIQYVKKVFCLLKLPLFPRKDFRIIIMHINIIKLVTQFHSEQYQQNIIMFIKKLSAFHLRKMIEISMLKFVYITLSTN